VLRTLALSLRLAVPGEPVSPRGLLARFDPAALPREAWIVDPATL
jgi:glutamyl-tRNA synthetase